MPKKLFATLSAAEVFLSAQERILAEPRTNVSELIAAESTQTVSEAARSLMDQHLIVFEVEGQFSCPSFQFDSDNQPLELVTRVNTVLGASEDPWGVASWWMFPNVRVSGRTPVSLLAENRRLLTELAAAVIEPVS